MSTSDYVSAVLIGACLGSVLCTASGRFGWVWLRGISVFSLAFSCARVLS